MSWVSKRDGMGLDPGLAVPHAKGPIVARTDNLFRSGMNRHIADPAGMTLPLMKEFPRVHAMEREVSRGTPDTRR